METNIPEKETATPVLKVSEALYVAAGRYQQSYKREVPSIIIPQPYGEPLLANHVAVYAVITGAIPHHWLRCSAGRMILELNAALGRDVQETCLPTPEEYLQHLSLKRTEKSFESAIGLMGSLRCDLYWSFEQQAKYFEKYGW